MLMTCDGLCFVGLGIAKAIRVVIPSTKSLLTLQRYVENQLREDMMTDQLTIKEYKDPFKG